MVLCQESAWKRERPLVANGRCYKRIDKFYLLHIKPYGVAQMVRADGVSRRVVGSSPITIPKLPYLTPQS